MAKSTPYCANPHRERERKGEAAFAYILNESSKKCRRANHLDKAGFRDEPLPRNQSSGFLKGGSHLTKKGRATKVPGLGTG